MRGINYILIPLLMFIGCGSMFGKEPKGDDHSLGQDEYHLLATSRTSTMEKEMNQAVKEGFSFKAVMGGNTFFGDNEMVVLMSRHNKSVQFEYLVLATNKTSTMEKEMRGAGKKKFKYKGQTVFETRFGGQEIVVIMERDSSMPGPGYDYKLLATKKTSTMLKEINLEAAKGFKLVGLTVGNTTFGDEEVVTIMERSLAGKF